MQQRKLNYFEMHLPLYYYNAMIILRTIRIFARRRCEASVAYWRLFPKYVNIFSSSEVGCFYVGVVGWGHWLPSIPYSVQHHRSCRQAGRRALGPSLRCILHNNAEKTQMNCNSDALLLGLLLPGENLHDQDEEMRQVNLSVSLMKVLNGGEKGGHVYVCLSTMQLKPFVRPINTLT